MNQCKNVAGRYCVRSFPTCRAPDKFRKTNQLGFICEDEFERICSRHQVTLKQDAQFGKLLLDDNQSRSIRFAQCNAGAEVVPLQLFEQAHFIVGKT